MDRRAAVPAPESEAAAAAERRRFLRRRSDARTMEETIRNAPADAIVKTFTLGGAGARRSALYKCGCVAVDPGMADANLQLLECPTHAALQLKLRRRRTDHH